MGGHQKGTTGTGRGRIHVRIKKVPVPCTVGGRVGVYSHAGGLPNSYQVRETVVGASATHQPEGVTTDTGEDAMGVSLYTRIQTYSGSFGRIAEFGQSRKMGNGMHLSGE